MIKLPRLNHLTYSFMVKSCTLLILRKYLFKSQWIHRLVKVRERHFINNKRWVLYIIIWYWNVFHSCQSLHQVNGVSDCFACKNIIDICIYLISCHHFLPMLINLFTLLFINLNKKSSIVIFISQICYMFISTKIHL